MSEETAPLVLTPIKTGLSTPRSTPKGVGSESPIVRALRSVSRTLTEEPENPRHRNELKARWKIMLLLCFGLFGSYYVFDIPAATEGAMQSAVEGNAGADRCVNGTNVPPSNSATATFNTDFNLLYSVYSWPNIILPFFGGYISDRLGVRLMAVAFTGLIAIGQAITTLGSTYLTTNSQAAWVTMWVGRTVFGFGGESLSVAQSAFIAQYFQGKELAFAMGVTLAVARVGSVVNNELSAIIASSLSVWWAYALGFIVTLLSVLCMVWAYYMDVKAEDRIREASGLPALQRKGLLYSLFVSPCAWLSQRCCRRKESGDEEGITRRLVDAADGKVAAPAPPTEEIRMSAVFSFPLIFWVLTMSCLTCYICVLVFNNNCADFVTQKWLTERPIWQLCDADRKSLYLTANTIMSITYLVAGFLTPIFGTIVDRIGKRAVLNVVAAGCITGVHAVLGLTTVYPAAPLVILGLSYSLYAAALWPSIALVIEPKNQATAYGLVTAVQNFGLAVGPLIVGQLMPAAQCSDFETCISGWKRTEFFFVGLGCAGVVCGILLNIVDCTRKYSVLNLSDAQLTAKKIAAGDLPPLSPPPSSFGGGEEEAFPIVESSKTGPKRGTSVRRLSN